MQKIAAIIVAAGEGMRLPGDRPKAYRLFCGKPLWQHSFGVFKAHAAIGRLVLVANPAHREWLGEQEFVPGGATRQESVANGLAALAENPPEVVLIHDAARPFVDAALIDRVIEALAAGHPAVVTAVTVKDTIKQVAEGRVTTPNRHELYAAQTPQGFDYGLIAALHSNSASTEATDDAQLAEWAGVAVHLVSGDERNKKITTPEDLPMTPRTGMGFDVHRLIPGDGVWIGGVKIPCEWKLEGHSDADAGLHALTDAILGAVALADIGQHFPPSDPQWKGADSSLFLAHAAKLAAEKGAQIQHCDLTIICEKPKIGPYREAMRARIAEILALPMDAVSVKATTTEGLGFTGRGEGIAAQAVVTVLQ